MRPQFGLQGSFQLMGPDCIHLSIYLSIYRSIYLSIYLYYIYITYIYIVYIVSKASRGIPCGSINPSLPIHSPSPPLPPPGPPGPPSRSRFPGVGVPRSKSLRDGEIFRGTEGEIPMGFGSKSTPEIRHSYGKLWKIAIYSWFTCQKQFTQTIAQKSWAYDILICVAHKFDQWGTERTSFVQEKVVSRELELFPAQQRLVSIDFRERFRETTDLRILYQISVSCDSFPFNILEPILRWWWHRELEKIQVIGLLGLVSRKIYRKPPFVVGKARASCRFSSKSSQWSRGISNVARNPQ